MQKTILLMALVLGFSVQGRSQVIDDGTSQRPEKIYSKVDVEAAFNGGDAAWKTYLQTNLKANTASANGAPSGTYTVIVKFIVHKNGWVSDVTAETNHGFGMEAEAMRLFKRGPKWMPATIGGVRVSSYRRQSVTFLAP